MGKSKDKKKVSGAVKTAAKTEKKLENKRKKELANLGEEDIETIVKSIEKEEAKKLVVVEKAVAPPSPRVAATLVPHPTNSSELILFGGEHHDGKKTYVYNNLYIYNVSKAEWRVIKAPGAPAPRSAHQAVTLSSNKGEMWVFGGEFTSPSELQFYHYKDLWLYNIPDRKWHKLDVPGGPSARSGHRMVALKRLLVVFGGYHDNGNSCRYYGDLHAFCTETRIWRKLEASGPAPAPRSACLLMPEANEKLLVYGGYSRVRDGKLDRGMTHSDLFRLSPVVERSPLPGAPPGPREPLKLRWEALKGGPHRPAPPRSSFSACLAPNSKAYVFGGIYDTEETEEELTGEQFNSLHCLELDAGVWRQVILRGTAPKQSKEETKEKLQEVEEVLEEENPITVCSDGVFTMTVGGGASSTMSAPRPGQDPRQAAPLGGPCPRMSAMMTVQKTTLYLYGGLVEKREKQFTLSDMYSLDLHKMDEWKTLSEQQSLPEWCGSDSESGEEESDEEGSDSQDEESGEET